MEFKKVLISELSPARYNPRKNLQSADPEYQRIKKSIEEFGYVDPIIINSDYTVIGGHQRLKVLKEIGQAQIDVVVVDIPKNKEKALNVALNKISGEWDTQRLTDLLGELKTEGMLDLTGFDENEFDGLLRELHKDDEPADTEPQISRAEELRKEWGTELGQLWQCGDHRVLCGDCTDLTNVKRLMQGEMADMVFTDPPYNVGKDFKNDNQTEQEYYYFIDKAVRAVIQHISSNATIMVWCCEKELFTINSVLSDISTMRRLLVWVYTGGIALESNYSKQTEFLFYNVLNEKDFIFNQDEIRVESERMRLGDKRCGKDGKVPPNWFEVPRLFGNFKERTDHPTQKPIDVVLPFVEAHSNTSVLDPFLGSGTTMIACENLGRKCRGMEIDPGYVAVILQRYKDTFPGKEIRLIE